LECFGPCHEGDLHWVWLGDNPLKLGYEKFRNYHRCTPLANSMLMAYIRIIEFSVNCSRE